MEQSKGLGDSIEKVTKATGLKSLMDISMGITGVKDCGCNNFLIKTNKNGSSNR